MRTEDSMVLIRDIDEVVNVCSQAGLMFYRGDEAGPTSKELQTTAFALGLAMGILSRVKRDVINEMARHEHGKGTVV